MKGNKWWVKYATLGIFGIAAITLAGLAMFPDLTRLESNRNPSLAVQEVQNIPPQTIQVGGRDVHVTIADTISSRERGLGDRTGLAPDEGMLFVFASDAKYGFWMKDMHFPIDILWLSGRGEVLDMRKDVSPATYPAIFTPKAPARFVLELPAGFSEAYNVKIGDEVKMR